MPAHRFPDLTTSLAGGSSVYAALREGHGARLRYGWRSLSAAAATADEADLLDVPPGSPLILREGVNVDGAGTPVVFLSRRMRGDRFKYVLRYDIG